MGWKSVLRGGVVAAKVYQLYQTRKQEKIRQAAEEERLLNSGIAEVDRMSGKEFEQFLAVHFSALGYQVRVTQDSQDYGADLIVTAPRVTFVVQAKRSKNPVGIKAIQEAIGAIKHYQADQAMVITNSTFTQSAYNLAQSNQIRLCDRQQLVDFMLQGKI